MNLNDSFEQSHWIFVPKSDVIPSQGEIKLHLLEIYKRIVGFNFLFMLKIRMKDISNILI